MVLAWPLEAAEALQARPNESTEGERPLKAQRSSLLSPAPLSTGPQLPPLTGVAVVCRQFPRLWALRHAVDLISEFADGAQNWFLVDASGDAPSVRLLRRLHAREQLDPLISDRFFRDWQFNRAANAAAAHGNLEVLKWLVTEYAPGDVVTEAAPEAATNGQLEVIKWLYEEYPFAVVGLEELGQAAQNAHLEAVKYLLAHPPPVEYRSPPMSDQLWTRETQHLILDDDAFQTANLEYLQWAVENGYVGGGFELAHAARSCRLAVVQWLAGHLNQLFKNGGGLRAIENNEEETEARGLFQEVDFESDADDDYDDEDWAPGGNENHGNERGLEGEDAGEANPGNSGPTGFCFPQSVDMNDMPGTEGFKVAKWLHLQNFSWLKLRGTSEAMEMNISCPDYVKWLVEHNYGECTGCVIDCAAIHGDLELLKWLHANCSSDCSTHAMDGAAAHGDLDIVKWIHENRSEGCTDDAVRRAMAQGHFEIAKWLLQNRLELNPEVAMASLVRYRLEMYMSSRRRPSIGVEKDLDMVKWLIEQYPHAFDNSAKLNADNVASRGHLRVLKELLKNNIVECTSATMDAAATNNRLEVVRYLHENLAEGCTTKAMDRAAANGYLDIVKYLHNNRTEGCTTLAMDLAIANGHLDVVKWLYDNRSEGTSDHQIDEAAQYGFFDLVRWMTENCGHEKFAKCTAAAMDGAASRGDLRMVRYLHKHRSEGCTTEAMDSAAENGHFEVLLFLHANRTEGCTDKALELAFHFEHLEILRWLAFHYPHLYKRNHLLGNMWRNVKPLVVNWVRHGGLPVKGSC